MSELLTHVLVAITAATILSWRYESITPPLIAAAGAGALIPDFVKIRLLVPSETVEAALGVPFAWAPLHQLGGTVLVILLGATLARRGSRGPVLAMLSLGTFSHVFLDSLLYKPDGLAFEFLWPLTTYRFEIEGFYLSSDAEPLLFALPLTITVLGITTLMDRDPADAPRPALPPAPGHDPRHVTDGGWTVDDADDGSHAD